MALSGSRWSEVEAHGQVSGRLERSVAEAHGVVRLQRGPEAAQDLEGLSA